MRRSDTIDILRVCMAYIIVIYHLFLIGIVIFPGGGNSNRVFFHGDRCIDESFFVQK